MAEEQEDGWAGPGWELPVRDVCRNQGHLSTLQGWLTALFNLAAVGSEERVKALIPLDDSAT